MVLLANKTVQVKGLHIMIFIIYSYISKRNAWNVRYRYNTAHDIAFLINTNASESNTHCMLYYYNLYGQNIHSFIQKHNELRTQHNMLWKKHQ